MIEKIVLDIEARKWFCILSFDWKSFATEIAYTKYELKQVRDI
jgi:hypothetical protein